jgi:hypothetical protein
MSNALEFAIEELREQLANSVEAIKQDPKMTLVLKYHAALNTMEELVGLSPTSLTAAFGLESAVQSVQPGEFYGLGALKAAKRFLKKRGKPASIDEIVTAVKAGGATVPSVDKLRVSLSRSTSDIAKVGPDHYGLLEFYPHVTRGKKAKDSQLGGALPLEDDDDNEEPDAEIGNGALKLDEDDIEDLVAEADKQMENQAEK